MIKLKKILFFLDFPFALGGSSKVLLTQAFIMKQQGYQVKVIIPNNEEGLHAAEYDEICKGYGLEIITGYYNVSICMENIDIISALRDYTYIIELLERHRPDLIHSVQLNIAVELAARELHIPHVMNIYPVDLQTFNISWLDVYPQYHSADSLLFSERWGKGLGIPSKCVRVAYLNSAKEERDYRNKEKTIHILSSGILSPHKNQLEIIKFVRICKEDGRDVKLTILGKDDNDYGNMCKKFIQDNNLQDNVILCGFVLDVESYWRKADVFVLASTVESYPGVIVESMANKVPIVTTAVAGLPELLKDEKNAFLASGSSAEDIYDAFLRYLEYRNSGKLLRIIENAYNTYLEQHDSEVIGRQLDEYYQWIMEDYHNKSFSCLPATEIKQRFDRFLSDKKIDLMEKKLLQKIWLFYHINEEIKKRENKKIVIWGAGYWGGITLSGISFLEEQIDFLGFIDLKKKGEYLGYPILQDRDNVIAECGVILVALADHAGILEIMNYLDEREKVRNRDYFLICNLPTIRY